MMIDRPYVLVHFTGFDAAGDTQEPLDKLTDRDCEVTIAAFKQAPSAVVRMQLAGLRQFCP